MTVHETLVGGLNLLEEKGWGRGDFGDGKRDLGKTERTHCAYTACLNATDDRHGRALDAVTVLCDLLGFTDDEALGSPKVADLFRWNDSKHRSYKQVRALFLEAIEKTAPEPAWGDLDEKNAFRPKASHAV